jgi:hypothetical protein
VDVKGFRVSKTINATPAAIWALMTDAPRIAEWDPGLDHIEGTIAPGQKIKVITKANPGRTFPITVTEFEPGRRMVWSGGMPLGLFKGVRTYTLAPTAGGGTSFTMEEVYSGLLAPLITRSIPDLSGAFEDYGAGLKRRAEAAAGR